MTRVYWCAQHATVRDSELARFKAHEAGACSCNNDGAAPNGEGSVKAAAAAAAAAVHGIQGAPTSAALHDLPSCHGHLRLLVDGDTRMRWRRTKAWMWATWSLLLRAYR